jgi:hypothetical protein
VSRRPSPGSSLDHRRRRLVFIFGSLAVVATMAAGLTPHVLAVIAGVIAIIAAVITFVFIAIVDVDDH